MLTAPIGLRAPACAPSGRARRCGVWANEREMAAALRGRSEVYGRVACVCAPAREGRPCQCEHVAHVQGVRGRGDRARETAVLSAAGTGSWRAMGAREGGEAISERRGGALRVRQWGVTECSSRVGTYGTVSQKSAREADDVDGGVMHFGVFAPCSMSRSRTLRA